MCGLCEQIGPQFRFRDTGDAFDFRDTLGRDTLLAPTQNGGAMHPHRIGNGGKAVPGILQTFVECCSHEKASCATHNRLSSPVLSIPANDLTINWVHSIPMSKVQSFPGKQVARPHYIAEWAERYSWRQADIVEQTGADKSLVSRWFSGATPGKVWQERLAALFQIEAESLFRHPDDDWIARFLQGRDRAEVERIKQTLETAFPRKQAS